MPRRMKSKKAAQEAAQRSEKIAEKVQEMAKQAGQLDINENEEIPNVEAEKPQELPEKTSPVENEANEQEKQAENPAPKKKKEKKKRVSAVQIEANQKAAADRFAEYRRQEAEKLKNMNDEDRTAYKNDKAAKRKENRTKSQYGLIFPIMRTRKYLKMYMGVPNKTAKNRRAGILVKKEAAIFAAAVLEYMCAEVLEISGNVALEKKRQRIKPRDILLAIRDDEEINKLISKDAVFCQSGVVPKQIPAVLLKTNQKSNAWTSTVAANCYSNVTLDRAESSIKKGSKA